MVLNNGTPILIQRGVKSTNKNQKNQNIKKNLANSKKNNMQSKLSV